MLNRTRQNLDKYKSILLRQQKKVEQDIKSLAADDVVMSRDLAAESSEPGTDSWMADVHTRAVASKHLLQDLLDKTRKSLMSLKNGKYGKCEKCKKDIEESRLKVMPTATLCISCSKKSK